MIFSVNQEIELLPNANKLIQIDWMKRWLDKFGLFLVQHWFISHDPVLKDCVVGIGIEGTSVYHYNFHPARKELCLTHSTNWKDEHTLVDEVSRTFASLKRLYDQ